MNKLTKVTIITIAILLILITCLIYLGSLKKNHIREIKVTGSQLSAALVDTKINLKFSRPVNRENIKNYISIYPETDFNANFIQNDLQISFTKNLDSNTTYSLKLSKDIKDIYKEDLESEFIYEFKTKEQKILFIKKENNSDKVVESSIDFSNQMELYESKKIKGFKKVGNYLLVVTVNEDRTQNIVLKNLLENSIKDFKLENQSIFSFDMSDKNVLFLAQKVEVAQRFLSPQGSSTINIYNIENGELKLFNPSNTGVNTLFAKFSPDNQNVIYKSSDSFFYLANLDESEPVAIGRFKTYGAFNTDLNKIIFTEFDPLQTYSSFQFISIFNSNRELNKVTTGEYPVVDPKFFHNSDDIIFSSENKPLEGSTGIFKIVKYNGSGFEDIYADDDNSLELPEVSFDDKYLVFEKYSKEDLLDFENQRDFIDYTKPLYGSLVSFDLNDKKFIGQCENCIEAEFGQ